jgi:hypothetical protein
MGSFSNSGAGDAFDSSNRAAAGRDSEVAKELEKRIAERATDNRAAADRARDGVR